MFLVDDQMALFVLLLGKDLSKGDRKDLSRGDNCCLIKVGPTDMDWIKLFKFNYIEEDSYAIVGKCDMAVS